MKIKIEDWLSPFLFIILSVIIWSLPQHVDASATALVASPYLYNFNAGGVVSEIGSLSESSSPYWWVNSGAYLKMKDGRGGTNMGKLAATDPWRLLYSANNSADTDQGYHPQNIFRLVTRSKWTNARQEAYFLIKADNLSTSGNRNASNGLLLLSRYKDGQNLYYMGVRVDGSAIIKKKKNGTYYTLAEIKNVYPGEYNKSTAPNLLPKNKWIGLRSETKNLASGQVELSLYIDKGWQGTWQLVARVVDDGQTFGGSALSDQGFGGIRTDFMDVEFENFRIRSL